MNKLIYLIYFILLFELLQAQENKNIELINYLKTNWATPENYVINKFTDHDYVFIGEQHRIKHDVELINNLIPLLYKNHIYNLCIELGKYKNQKLVDSLINAPVFDRKLADSIQFEFDPVWGYKEYIDLYQTAWEVNHSSNSDTNKFRIINLFCDYNPCLKDQFNGFDFDKFMANVIQKEVVSKKQKALIYSGGHHAFTRYHKPIYDFSKDSLYGFSSNRMGNIIYDSLKERTFNIYLHSSWFSNKGFDSPSVMPVNGIIDTIMNYFNDKRVGFDIINSPFGKLTANDTYYAIGFRDFKLEYFCDGYIYQNSFKDYQPITMEKDFITKNNLSRLKNNLKCRRFSEEGINDLTIENANEELFEDCRNHFKHLTK